MVGLPKGQREQTLVFIAFIAIVAIGAFWYFVYSPRSAQIAAQKARVESLRSQNEKAKSEMATGSTDDLRAQLAKYQQNLTLIRTLVPTSNEVPALLEQVSTAARRVGLDLAAVDPQPVINGEDYDTYRYSIGVVGSYHDLASFLTNVGSLTRIVAPINMQLGLPGNPAAAKSKQKRAEAVIDARFQIQTYVARTSSSSDGSPKNGDN